MTAADAQRAARIILGEYGPRHVARLRELETDARPWVPLDQELGPVRRTDGSMQRRGLVHSYGGCRSRVMSALTPLGRACLDLAGKS